MTNKSKIYTRTGDLGTTSLIGGSRIKKNDPRVEAYGTSDELNSFIALLLAQPSLHQKERDTLTEIQQKLFDLGAYLANDSGDGMHEATQFGQQAISLIEHEIDNIDSQLPALNSFILPGGSGASAIANVCRTVCRRLERNIVALNDNITVDNNVIKYVNRLSDYLFVLGRLLNHQQGITETTWHPSK